MTDDRIRNDPPFLLMTRFSREYLARRMYDQLNFRVTWGEYVSGGDCWNNRAEKKDALLP